MEGVRNEAHAEGKDISELVNEFLRQGLLNRRRMLRQAGPLPRFSMGRSPVNLADRDALEGVMES